jgi:hypothetical protein
MLAVLALLGTGVNAQQANQDQTKVKKPVTTDQVTLVLKGVDCQKCSMTLTKILTDDGIKLDGALVPAPGEPVNIVGTAMKTMDLSALVTKIHDAQTPHRSEHAPALMLGVFNENKNQKAEEVTAALKKITAIDSAASTYNNKTGQIDLAFTGKTKITFDELMAQLKSNGLMVNAVNPVKTKS